MPSEFGTNHRPAKPRAFISYSRTDAAFCSRLADALEARGYEPTYDQSERVYDDPDARLTAQDEWWTQLKAMIAACDVMIFVVSPNSAASAVCDNEIAYARSLGKRVIPILRDAIDFRTAPERLRALNVKLDFRDDSGSAFDASLANLVAELGLDIDWHRRGTRLIRQAQQWDADGRPDGQLLRAGAITDADAWAARRPRDADGPGILLLAFLDASRTKEESDTVRLRSLIGRGFVMPVEQAVRERRYEFALRLMAGGAALSEDWRFALSPELFRAGAVSIAQSSLRNSRQALPASIKVITGDSAGNFLAVSGGHQILIESRRNLTTRLLEGHSEEVLHVKFSPDGTQLLSAAADGTVCGWRADNGERRFSFDALVEDADGYGDYTFADYSPAGEVFMISSPQGPKIMNTDSLDHITTLEHSAGSVWHASFSPDGKLVATACLDGRVRIWSTKGWRVVATLHPNQQAVMTAHFSPCGSRLVTHTLDTGCQIWSVADWSVVARFNETPLCSSQTGALLLTAASNVGRVWDLRNGALVSELRGHSANIDAATFFRDERIATLSSDGASRVWSAHDGQTIDVILAEGGPFSAVAFDTADEVRTGSKDGRLRTWRVGAKFGLGTVHVTNRPGELLGLSSGGEVYATYSSMDGGCRVLDGSSNNLLSSRDIGDASALGADFSGDAGRCVAWFSNGDFVVWDVAKNEDVLRSAIEPDEIFGCRLSSDASKLAAKASGKAYLYPLKTSARPFIYEEEFVCDVAFADQQLRCVIIDSDAHTAIVRDLPSRRTLKKMQCDQDEEFSARLSSDGRWLITSPSRSEIRWVAVEGFGTPKRQRLEGGELLATDVFNGELCLAEKLPNGHVLLRALPRMNILGEIGFEIPVQSIQLCSKSRTVVCGLADATTRRFSLLDSQTNSLTVEPLGTKQVPAKIVGSSHEVLVKVAHDKLAICNADNAQTSNILRAINGIECVALSANDELIAIGCDGGGAQVWRRSPLERLHRLRGQGRIASVRFHPNERDLCVGSKDGKSTWIWNLENGEPSAKLEHVGEVSDVQFSPDGRFLMVRGDDPPVIIWNADTWTEHARLEFKCSYLVDAQFSSGGRLFATAGWDDAVRLWDVATWREIAQLQDVGTRPSKISFDALDQRMVVGTDAGLAFVYDLLVKAASARLVGHSAKITCASFLASADIAVTASEDTTVRFWDVASGAELYRIDGHERRVFDVAVSRDGARAVTSAADQTVKVWSIDHLGAFKGDPAEYVAGGLQSGRGEILNSEHAHLLLRDVPSDLLSAYRSGISP